ncbi:hypothetical protein [Halocynthiibacter styelae]|uniref:Uncharacterized protein n=1 Tax=Halocynthiibacter styelae TaxID=2761955 RepID=A0A8J7J444_9RHOB|nr:hypothetical protein [Paenihalocynthiibacter styelae]MBI1492960.1 hypothetical protein [Paenihalocynthiibacter styelae]
MNKGLVSARTENKTQPHWLSLLLLSLLILAGHLQLVDTDASDHYSGLVQSVYLLVQTSPAIPLVCVTIRFLRGRPASPVLIRMLAISAFLSGILLTLINAVLSSSASFQISTLHGVSLTFTATAGFLILSFGRLSTSEVRLAWSGFLISSAAAFWSLLTVPVILIQAGSIASGNPYCLAQHSRQEQTSAATDLRGFSFYSTATGFKSTSNWHFHGVLIVEAEDGQKFFNWSPRRFRFDRIDNPQRYIVPFENLCMPAA